LTAPGQLTFDGWPPRFSFCLGSKGKVEGISMANAKLRAAGYCRTSGEAQRDNTSIPTQRNGIESHIERHDWTFLKHYVDECKSGSKIAGRDAFQQMMRDAASNNFDVLVVYNINRFSRRRLR
jgi:DNA invertase Pin-like site-specific DNA recombinase